MLGPYETSIQANTGWNTDLKSWVEAHQIIGAPIPLPINWITPAMLLPYMVVAPSGTPFVSAIQAHILTVTILIDSQALPTYTISLVVPAFDLATLLFSKGNSASADDIRKLFYQWLQAITMTVTDTFPVAYPCTIVEI